MSTKCIIRRDALLRLPLFIGDAISLEEGRAEARPSENFIA
ncbi:MAG: hypothetical protein ACJ8NS_09675 [Chthoniobacterales bacterium]